LLLGLLWACGGDGVEGDPDFSIDAGPSTAAEAGGQTGLPGAGDAASRDGASGTAGGTAGAPGGLGADAGGSPASDAGATRDGAVSPSDTGTGSPADGGPRVEEGGAPDEFDAGPQIGLPSGVSYLFPPPNGAGLCPDPPLRLRFAGPPTLGSSGKIQVYSQAGAVVASVDMAASTISDSLGGTAFSLLRPVFVDGNDVVIGLKNKALAYGQSYYVTIDANAIKPSGGGTFSITGAMGWRFSTRAAPGNLASAKVALDGSGDFCSVQGALDAIPANNTSAALVTVAPGLYHEIVHMRGKSNVTLRGQDRKRTIILGTNNNNQNGGTATRALVGFDSTNGLIVENLTIHNLTPQNGSQAEALRLQGCDKCVVRNADILSLQDTLLWSGRIYASDLYVAGNVDYVWGTGTVYFNNCEFHTVGRTGVLVQARNAAGAYGYVFVDCKLSADAVATNNVLARIDASVYPGSHVAFINCKMANVSAAAWTITGGSATSALRFWEFQSQDLAGSPLNTGGRLGSSSQISSAQATMMRDPSVVLNGWTPPK
jgi:hypothetical protein